MPLISSIFFILAGVALLFIASKSEALIKFMFVVAGVLLILVAGLGVLSH